MDNSGSFMAPAGGGGDAVKAAMDRRGMSGGVLNQNTQDPNAVPPSMAPPSTNGLPPQAPGGSMAPMPMSTGGTPPMAGNPEAQLIIKAQNSYLSSLSKIAEAQAGVR